MLTRIEFIGKNISGETVSGHKFDTSIENVIQWLSEEHNIEKPVVALAGLLPEEEFVLEFDRVVYFVEQFPDERLYIPHIHAANKSIIDFMERSGLDNPEYLEAVEKVNEILCETGNEASRGIIIDLLYSYIGSFPDQDTKYKAAIDLINILSTHKPETQRFDLKRLGSK